MPILLNQYSRRDFIKRISFGVAGIVLGVRSDFKISGQKFVLIADTHISSNLDHERRGVNLADNFKEVVDRILSKSDLPCGVIINGDLARTRGRIGDYQVLYNIVKPLMDQGIQVYLILGNHDDRDNFNEALTDFRSDYHAIIRRHTIVLETNTSNLIMLDSLDVVNETPGKLGQNQLNWLADLLTTINDKPTIIFAHHFPETGTGSGLQDYDLLHQLMVSHKKVKAFVYGHSHRWEVSQSDSIYHVNIPSTAYVFRGEQPLGYVNAEFRENGIFLNLESLDTNHPWHGEQGFLHYSNLDSKLNSEENDVITVYEPAPNPFNNSTSIRFQLNDTENLSIDLFTLDGKFVKNLFPNRSLLPGEHSVQFSANGLSSGRYFIRFRTGSQVKTRIVTFVK